MTVLAGLPALLGALASVAAVVRWMRVAQREHYLPRSTLRFVGRWWVRAGWVNRMLAAVGLAAAGLAVRWPDAAYAGVAVALLGPVGLGVRGRTSPLAWTRRCRTTTAVVAVLVAAWLAGSWGLGTVAVGVGRAMVGLIWLVVPVAVVVALALTGPIERRLSQPFVDRAAATIRRVRPRIVAVTGSYGKTTTKGYIAHVVGGRFVTVASPASFNNRLGLARAVNERLRPDTEVLVAEMGAFGPGEIRSLCAWCPPEIGVITALGPVHLERFRTEDAILRAKSEIVERAPVAVVNVDHPRLAALAEELRRQGRRVWRCATGEDAGRESEVRLELDGAGGRLHLRTPEGEDLPTVVLERVSGVPSNVACTVGVGLALGLAPEEIGARLADLPTAPHRLEEQTGESGVRILDDTYNSNPAGARLALRRLEEVGAGGRRVVVTPGMVELGPRQFVENAALGGEIARVATDVVIVARTNRKALRHGVAAAAAGPDRPAVHWVAHREEAVRWVRGELGPGDAVLYENDLPDHYP